jgi:5-methylcytosine-specific restriction enzyme subunit McrC
MHCSPGGDMPIGAVQTIHAAHEGLVGRVPVRNLWLLMLYASDLFRTGGLGNVDVEESPDDLPDLIAEVLAGAAEMRLRKRLTSGYRRNDRELHRVRGRIDILATERRHLLARGMIACQFDELSVDTPRNRLVRGALAGIASLVLGPALAHRCRALARELAMMGVSDIVPTRAQFSVERLGRHDAHDAPMIAAARLAFDMAIPTESSGANALPSPSREEVWVRRLFERAVGGFYDVALRQEGWRVRTGTPLAWPVETQTIGIAAILPGMRTDIILENPALGRRVVIDTKFTSVLARGWHREQSLRSGYIYQMYAYLRSQAVSVQRHHP